MNSPRNNPIRSFLMLFLIFIFQYSISQKVVEVRDEPFHKPVFQNQYIRLLNVIIPPGDTSFFHRHYLPSIFVFLDVTKIGMQDLGSGPGQLTTALGQTWFNGYEKGAQIHRAWTSDDHNLHAIDIEILNFDPNDKDPLLSGPNLELISESAPARIYKLKVDAGQSYKTLSNGNPVVVVPYTGAIKANRKSISKSGYHWLNEKRIEISTDAVQPVLCYVYEIRI